MYEIKNIKPSLNPIGILNSVFLCAKLYIVIQHVHNYVQ